MEMTKLEKIVFEAMKNECWDEYCSDVGSLSEMTGLEKNVIKGVVGSLTKKGLVCILEEDYTGKKFNSICPIVDGQIWSFASEFAA